MKPVFIMIAIGGLAIAGFYFFGGYRDLDPSEQGRQAKAAIKPGMSWKKVIDAAGEPQSSQVFYRKAIEVNGEMQDEVRLAPRHVFDLAEHNRLDQKGELTDGFIFRYDISPDCSFEVAFDEQGDVIDVSDAITISDVYSGKAFGLD
jgi:hypothetical protein